MKITAGITVKEAREQFHIYLGQQATSGEPLPVRVRSFIRFRLRIEEIGQPNFFVRCCGGGCKQTFKMCVGTGLHNEMTITSMIRFEGPPRNIIEGKNKHSTVLSLVS